MIRRFVSYHFSVVIFLGVLSITCCEFTLVSSRIRPVYRPLMACLILVSFSLLALFAASFFLYLQGHFFRKAGTRRLLVALLALLFALYALLLAFHFQQGLAGRRSVGGSMQELWHRYSLAFSGTADPQLRSPSLLDNIHSFGAFLRRRAAAAQPVAYAAFAALLLPPFLVRLFYRSWRNHLIAGSGYDLDNNLDLLFAALSLPTFFMGLAVHWWLLAAVLLLAVPFLRRLRPLGLFPALLSVLCLPFLLLDVALLQGAHIFSTFLAGTMLARVPPTLDNQFVGRIVQGLDRYNGEIEDEMLRQDLLEAYRRRRGG